MQLGHIKKSNDAMHQRNARNKGMWKTILGRQLEANI